MKMRGEGSSRRYCFRMLATSCMLVEDSPWPDSREVCTEEVRGEWSLTSLMGHSSIPLYPYCSLPGDRASLPKEARTMDTPSE